MGDFTKKVSDLKKFKFKIEKYQRGYKWTPRQVLDLLEDVNKSAKEDAPYSLQPLAVKELDKNNKKFEVIDGQQRLTTIYLILKVLNENLFTIEYNTRERSYNFLNKIKTEINIDIEHNEDYKEFIKTIDEKWKDFIQEKTEYDNIDNYYFFSAYLTIKAWFKKNSSDFKNKLLENTFFIWYEDNNKKAEEVFRNLNSGKIPLTNAELIKALFIVKQYTNEDKEVQELQRNTFAREWDMIEQELNNDAFWYFINNNTNKNHYQTRIDFLFELETGKPNKTNKDHLYSYRKYANNEVELNWNNIKNNFLILKEWYDDKLRYHLVGFLIANKHKNKIKELIDLSKRKTKKEFIIELKKKVQNKINNENKFNDDKEKTLKYLKSLSFSEKSDKNEIHNILLLFNIAEYHKIEGFRFPFDRYKNTHWSLEHIFAQNASKFEKLDEVNAWIKEAKQIAKELPNKDEINIEGLELNNISEDNFKEKKKEIIETLKPITELLDSELHDISNMALLDGPTNSGLGNSSFPEKRKYIKDNLHKNFIPLATINVFQKYYTNEVKQMEFWGQADRDDYLSAIYETINNFIK